MARYASSPIKRVINSYLIANRPRAHVRASDQIQGKGLGPRRERGGPFCTFSECGSLIDMTYEWSWRTQANVHGIGVSKSGQVAVHQFAQTSHSYSYVRHRWKVLYGPYGRLSGPQRYTSVVPHLGQGARLTFFDIRIVLSSAIGIMLRRASSGPRYCRCTWLF